MLPIFQVLMIAFLIINYSLSMYLLLPKNALPLKSFSSTIAPYSNSTLLFFRVRALAGNPAMLARILYVYMYNRLSYSWIPLYRLRDSLAWVLNFWLTDSILA